MSSTFFHPSDVDVAALRKRMHMTQKQFCRRFGFTLATLGALLNTAYRDRYMREIARQRLDDELDPFE